MLTLEQIGKIGRLKEQCPFDFYEDLGDRERRILSDVVYADSYFDDSIKIHFRFEYETDSSGRLRIVRR